MTGSNLDTGLLATIQGDIRAKALWLYELDRPKDLVKALLTDGTMAMIIYRLMQWSRRWRLVPLELIFNKLNVVCCRCVIGRGAEFGPEFVLVHSDGVFINGEVRGGRGIKIEHQVTIGAQGRLNPILGDGVFLGAGCKIIGGVRIGNHAKIGANAVVVHEVPDHCTAVGVPARILRGGGPELVSDSSESDAKSRVSEATR
jgi:serine O-acetyltransferase